MAGCNQRNDSEQMRRLLQGDLVQEDRPGPACPPNAVDVPERQLVVFGDEGTQRRDEGTQRRDEGAGTQRRDEGAGTQRRDEGTQRRDEGAGTQRRDEGTQRRDEGTQRRDEGAGTQRRDEGAGTQRRDEGTRPKDEAMGTRPKDEDKGMEWTSEDKAWGTHSNWQVVKTRPEDKDKGTDRTSEDKAWGTHSNWQVVKTRPEDKDKGTDRTSEDKAWGTHSTWQVASTKPEDKDKGTDRTNEDKAWGTHSNWQVARTRPEDEGTEWTSEDAASSCCRLDELKRLDQCETNLGRLAFSGTHAVLVDAVLFNAGGGLLPQEGRDIWAPNFVKMPCSPACTVKKSGSKVKVRWESIAKHLNALAKKSSVSVDHLEEVIMKFNPKYKGQWSFDALSSFVKVVPKEENDFAKLIPKMAALALSLPEKVKKAIPLLRHGQSASITLSQVQISSLLANAFFCTFPHRNTTSAGAEFLNYPNINFSSLFWSWSNRKKEKLRAIMHYFRVMTDDANKPRGLVTFERRSLRDSELPSWRSCPETMGKLYVSSGGSIETEGSGMLQVDFASSRLGGGVLGSGLVQEEILFLMNPELIVSRLFTEKLGDRECLVVTGSQRFSRYSGFGDSFQWAGPHQDDLARDGWSRLQRQIVAIDALNFRHQSDQYSMSKVTRELNKAYCGFKGRGGVDEPDIATGKWGCGAFNGDAQLKAVIQLMAAARAGRGLAFFTFRDEKLHRGLEATHRLLVATATTVGDLFSILENYCAAQQASGAVVHVELFQFLKNELGDSRL